jgi:hypothetical protein
VLEGAAFGHEAAARVSVEIGLEGGDNRLV